MTSADAARSGAARARTRARTVPVDGEEASSFSRRARCDRRAFDEFDGDVEPSLPREVGGEESGRGSDNSTTDDDDGSSHPDCI